MSTLTAPEWNGIIDHVKKHSPNVTRHWFDELSAEDLEHGVLKIRCANTPQQKYLSEHCARAFTEAVQVATGCLVSVRFATIGSSPKTSDYATSPSFPQHRLELNPEYRFGQFVTGPCNRLAHAASVAVSDAPGETYNPLFIHGSVGLGKTHLMHAICHNVRDNNRNAEILNLSCETFTNHFIEAVERGALHQFRYRYRHVDILLIDDIQFLAGRERTQEEFFHTFNTLYQARKQIVLSADCSPREIPSLEDRLISRFSWGLVSRIDSPCLETRIAIIRTKARLRNIEIPEEVTHYVASRIATNSRELEGAITTIDAYSQQLGRPIDLKAAREALGDHQTSTPQVTMPQILETVTQHFSVKKADLQGKRRSKSIAFPRQVCMFLVRELTSHSLEEIGSYFGGRDHTTVMHAVRLIGRLQKDDPNLSAIIEELKYRICDRGL